MPDNNITDLTKAINDLLSQTKLDDVTSAGSGFEELPQGYYLCNVESAVLKESKSSHQPMAAFTLSVTENGKTMVTDKDGNAELTDVKHSKGRKIFMYYVLKDTSSVRRFVSDMLKFEGEEPGKPLLDKEYFTTSELLNEALAVLVGCRIYVQVTKSERDDGTTQTWQNLISWQRAAALELPM